MSWAVGKHRRAAPQTAMMKMDVKPQETVKAKPVSNTCPLLHSQTLTYTRKSPYSFANCSIVGKSNKQVIISNNNIRIVLLLSRTFHKMSTPIFVMIYNITIIILIVLYLNQLILCFVYNQGHICL